MPPASCIELSDADDPRIADFRNVPDAELLASRGIFIAEGRLVVRRLLSGRRFPVRAVLVTATAFDALADLLRPPPCPVYIVPPAAMNAVAGFNVHRGCLAVGERRTGDHWRDLALTASLVIVLERVGNADNVGAIFRNAAAFGVSAVLLGPDCADPLYRKAIRTSMGAALRVPFASMPQWPADLETLARMGFATVGLTPASPAKALRDGLPRSSRIALLLGHEGEGLTNEALRACTTLLRIPMPDDVDSLNVATAAAIALYELTGGQQDLRAPR